VADTDTAALAHVLLPAATWGEKDGTVTNSERRISRQRRFLTPPGEARPDWWMICEVAKRMGFAAEFRYESPREIFDEHARLSALARHDAAARGTAASLFFDIGGLAGLSDAEYEHLEPPALLLALAAPRRHGGPLLLERPHLYRGRINVESARVAGDASRAAGRYPYQRVAHADGEVTLHSDAVDAARLTQVCARCVRPALGGREAPPDTPAALETADTGPRFPARCRLAEHRPGGPRNLAALCAMARGQQRAAESRLPPSRGILARSEPDPAAQASVRPAAVGLLAAGRGPAKDARGTG
jgi:anaerobic selenocysteine-containing dehydrogenase